MPQKLKKSGTMQQAAQEGDNYLERSWGADKLKRVKELIGATTSAASSSDESHDNEPTSKRPKLAKHSTMIATAKESEGLLKDSHIDSDAKTRHQANEISKLMPLAKGKPKLTKTKTMAATAKESEIILKNVNIDEDAKTRNMSKAIEKLKNSPAKLKKHGTMTATTQEALDFMTRQPLGASRAQKASKPVKKKTTAKKPKAKKATIKKTTIKKATIKKASLKKGGTMEQTAKEGKAYVKRLNKRSK